MSLFAKATAMLVVLFVIPLTAISAPRKSCGEFEAVSFSAIKIDIKNADGTETKDYAIQRGSAGSFRFDAGDTSAMIYNDKTQKSCDADLGIISGNKDVFWLNKTEQVLYRSYSGSNSWVTLVDAKTCKTLWKSHAHLNNKVEGATVTIQPDCGECEESGDFSGVCKCHSGEVWKLSANCKLKQDIPASKALTKEVLSVGFVGQKRVKAAKTEKASLVK
jgi:hypothetical protein